MDNTKATECGIEDAQTFMAETPDRDDWKQAIAPGTLDADEALLNAIGFAGAARLFGVAEGEQLMSACADYSKAWRDTVASALEG